MRFFFGQKTVTVVIPCHYSRCHCKRGRLHICICLSCFCLVVSHTWCESGKLCLRARHCCLSASRSIDRGRRRRNGKWPWVGVSAAHVCTVEVSVLSARGDRLTEVGKTSLKIFFALLSISGENNFSAFQAYKLETNIKKNFRLGSLFQLYWTMMDGMDSDHFYM